MPTIRIRTLHDPRNGKPIPAEMPAEIGTTFDKWHPLIFKPVDPAANKMIAVAEITKNGGQHELHDHDLRQWEAKVPDGTACRYLRLVASSSWNAGGSWVKPQESIKGIVHSDITVQGPASLSQVLPFPEVPHAPKGEDGLPIYYREIAVLAFHPPQYLSWQRQSLR